MRATVGVAWLLLVLSCTVHAEERIVDFHSDIVVRDDSSMHVRETIAVRAEGKVIRHGIYRDFPLDYRDRLGNRYRVGFHIVAVTRDGAPEPYHTQRQGNGMRIYMGDKGSYLARGEHVYQLIYDTDRQLGFFADHDELYWNVTGNGWSFPIERAGASVQLPSSIPAQKIHLEAYTGAFGSKGQDYTAGLSAGGAAEFTTTRALPAHEGLTVVVTWPKGYVKAPGLAQQLGYVLADNRTLLAALLGLLVVFGYYTLAWWVVGRDPAPGVIIPQYVPPKGFSPASMRFIRRMGYDTRTFAAAIVNLAVKGVLHIEEHGKDYTLRYRSEAKAELAPGEKQIVKTLLDGGRSIDLVRSNHQTIRAALKAHEAALRRDYEKLYFLTNRRWMVPGVLLTALVMVVGLLYTGGGQTIFAAVFASVWLTVWTVAVLGLVTGSVQAWRRAADAGGAAQAMTVSLIALPFVGAEVVGIWLFSQLLSPLVLLSLAAAGGVNFAFYHLLKAPTRAGRRLLDQVEGFRTYLDVAEKDELNLRYVPEKTPDLFEIYLPYALALDVEQRWAEHFAALFASLTQQGREYHPTWYDGAHWSSARLGGFATALGGSLSSAIASSSTAPGSSSGSGGGGSSGGGGGGGGGGGW